MRQRLLLIVVSFIMASVFPQKTLALQFQAEIQEGVKAWFVVLDGNAKTCQIGLGTNGYYTGANTFANAVSGEITIPSTVNGYTVTTVGWGAFKNYTDITAVVLPNTIEIIQPGAFYESGIESIEIPSSVTQINGSAFFYCKSLESVILHEGLTTIGNSAFNGCKSLTSITIPQSVQSIASSAFSACTSLEQVTIDNAPVCISQNAFSGCTKLTTLDLGNAVTSIGNSAFKGCPITSLDIPASVIEIEEWAFYNHDLSTLTLHDGLQIIGEGAFTNRDDNVTVSVLSLPNTLTTIGNSAFRGWRSITELIIPESAETIGELAFYRCTSLTTVKFGTHVKSVGESAFGSCEGITKVDIGDLKNWCGITFEMPTNIVQSNYINHANPLAYSRKIVLNDEVLDELVIPSGVTEIKSYTFNNCSRFDKVTIPTSVEVIGNGAFASCVDLETIDINTNSALSVIGDGAFYSCTGLTQVSLPSSITNLGEGAFRGCTNLTSVNIPSGINDIPKYLFYGCTSLSSITLPQNTMYIGSWSFYNCKGLTRIDIPNTVEIIGTEAFYGCTGLKGVYITDLAKWCGVKFGNYQYQGSNWEPSDKISNPLAYAHNLYLNNELVVNLAIPNGVETIEQFVFEGAECLESVVIPNTVTTIGKSAFMFCSNLRSITIPSSITTIAYRAFASLYTNGGYYSGIGILKSQNQNNVRVYLGNTDSWLTNNYGIGFYENGGLNIELYAGNIRITDIVVPSEVNVLEQYSLSRVLVNSVTLHKNIETVYNNCFYNDSQNISLYVQSKFAPDLKTSTDGTATSFLSVSKLAAIYVPNGKETAYKNKWSGHSSIIKEVDMTMSGAQTSSSIAGMKQAFSAINGEEMAFMDLSEATLDESVTEETLKEGDESGNMLYYLPSESEITGDNIIKNNVAASVSLTGGEQIFVPRDFTATSLSYSCSLTKGKATTICLPYNSAVPTGLKAYSLNETDDEGLPVFSSVNSIVANEPFLVVPSSSQATLDDADVSVVATPEEMPDAGNDDYEFRGTLVEISNADAAAMGAYVLGEDRNWHKVTTDDPTVVISAGSGYMVPKFDKGDSFETVLDIPAPITFADAEVKRICVENWDTDGDGELSYTEAAAVTDLGTVFQNNFDITSFDEFRYFTGITKLNGTFLGCGYLVSVKLPVSLTRIESNSFFTCSKLEAIEIPAGVTFITGTAFSYTSRLTSISVDTNNETYDSRDNCNAIIKTSTNELVRACNTTVIPPSVTSIGSVAYKYMNFFTEVTIPVTVQTIKAGAFQSNPYLISVTVEHTTPIEIDQATFSNRANATLYVPYGAKAAYEAATGWSEFKEIVENMPDNISITMATTSGSPRYAIGYSSNVGLDFTNVDKVKAWIATGYTDKGTVLLSRIKIVPPYTGLYLSTEEPGVTVEVPTTEERVYYANLLLPVVGQTTVNPTETIDDVEYTFYGVGTLNGKPSFAPFTKTQSYGPNKSLLRVPTRYVPAAARIIGGFDVEFLDEEATPIRDVIMSEKNLQGDYYDLQGRKVTVVKKGLYIQNGKKVFVNK